TPFNKVETITEGLNSYTIEYYPNQQKAATTLTHNSTVIEHKYYAGKAFEWETVNDKKYYYVYAEGQPIAVFIQDGDDSPLPYLILTDHLGSVDLITDRYGNVVDSMSFDAWGNRRNYQNWQQKDNSVHLIDRGFTMHQHLDSFKLINMEGRVYDPVVAQFLSPDPYVQAPDNTQGLNRYNYCYNSPLMYTDPDGEWVHFVVGAFIGGFANLTANWNNIKNAWQGFAYFGIGAVIGAASAGLGAGVSSAIAGTGFGAGFIGSSAASVAPGFFAGAASGGTAGVTSGFGLGFNNSLMQGNSVTQSLQKGAIDGLYAGTAGALLGGIAGGIYSQMQGKTFLSGAKVYWSPVEDNFGTQGGECALRCLEEFSKSYGMDQYDYNYWLKLNDSKLGVKPNDLENLIEKSGIFSSKRYGADDIKSIAEALSNNQRVLMGFNSNNGVSHAVMVSKLKIWPSGRYNIWFAETSPVRIAPYSTSNIFNINGAAFWSFFY
ncbi:MAG: RHS repeat-associated core domain-containing protein, partial [Bacteroidales bacterium]